MRDSEVKITILIWGAFLCRTRKSCAQPHPGLIHPAPGKTAGAPATGRWRSGSHVPLRAPASAGATPACQSSVGLPGFSRSCTARPGACRRDRGAAGPEALPPTASAPAPSRSGSAAPPTGQSRPMHCRAAGRRGPAALPAQRRDKPRAAASGHFRAAAAGPAPRRGARGRACAENPDNTPAAPGCKPVQRLLRNALRQDGVVDDGHMSLQRARRDAGPAIRQKAEAEHGGPAGKCCNFFTICRQIHRNRQ